LFVDFKIPSKEQSRSFIILGEAKLVLIGTKSNIQVDPRMTNREPQMDDYPHNNSKPADV